MEHEGIIKQTYDLQRSIKLTKVFLVPSRRICGGLMTVLRLSPASSGLFSRRIWKTRPKSCTNFNKQKIDIILTNLPRTQLYSALYLFHHHIKYHQFICTPQYYIPLHTYNHDLSLPMEAYFPDLQFLHPHSLQQDLEKA